jgi:uncharacterized C2H2 Zn-finger protein
MGHIGRTEEWLSGKEKSRGKKEKKKTLKKVSGLE